MKPTILFWENRNREKEWKAFSSWENMKQYLAILFASGVDPAKILVSSSSLYWLFPSRHNGSQTVLAQDILNIAAGHISGNHPYMQEENSKDFSESAMIDDSDLGWIAPDGRFFSCEYGGHANKAREIVGYLESIPDAQGFLESQNWFAVYRNPSPGKTLCIGSGNDAKNLSMAQLRTIQELGIIAKIANLSDYL